MEKKKVEPVKECDPRMALAEKIYVAKIASSSRTDVGDAKGLAKDCYDYADVFLAFKG